MRRLSATAAYPSARGQRSRPAARRSPRRRAAILGAIGAGLIAGGGALWQAGLIDTAVDQTTAALLDASGDVGLRIENVLVEGRAETGRAALLKAFGHGRGDPVFAVDTRAARARIEALPWVRSALVERRLPDTIYLRIAERRPMALWQRGERFWVVDWDGVVVEKDDIGRFRQLPVIVGDDAPAEAGRLFAFMESAPDLKARIVGAVRVGQRRWNLRLDNGIDIRLPESEPALAWAQFVELERAQKLTARDIVAVDLRQPGRLIVQMTQNGVARPRAPAKDT